MIQGLAPDGPGGAGRFYSQGPRKMQKKAKHVQGRAKVVYTLTRHQRNMSRVKGPHATHAARCCHAATPPLPCTHDRIPASERVTAADWLTSDSAPLRCILQVHLCVFLSMSSTTRPQCMYMHISISMCRLSLKCEEASELRWYKP